MPFRPEPAQPNLNYLKSTLLKSGLQNKNNALYQVVDQLIDVVRQFQSITVNDISSLSPLPDLTYLTDTNESASLPNSRQLLAGANIAFDDSVANQKTVKTADVAGFSILAKVTTGTGALAVLTAGTDSVLGRLSSADLAFNSLAAITKTDDTNVTLTLGGTPATSVIKAVSFTLGWTGQLSLARGGTNANITASHGALVYSTASAFALTGVGTSGQILKSAGAGAPTWNTPAALTRTDDTNVTLTLGGSASTALVNAASLTLGWTGQLAVARGGLGLSTIAAFAILYASATDTYTTLAPNTTTTKKFLRMTGTGSAGTAPVWDTVTGSDITGAALTVASDTNVTLTLGGTPSTALLVASSVTAGWTGTLSATRGGTGLNTSASSGVPTINSGTWAINNVLTSTRILFAGASNTITSSADLTWSGTVFIASGTSGAGGVVDIQARNLDTTGATRLIIGNNTSATIGRNQVFASGFTTDTYRKADGLTLECTGAGGCVLAATNASGALFFVAGGTTEHMRITTTGLVGIGTTTPSSYTDSQLVVRKAGDNASVAIDSSIAGKSSRVRFFNQAVLRATISSDDSAGLTFTVNEAVSTVTAISVTSAGAVTLVNNLTTTGVTSGKLILTNIITPAALGATPVNDYNPTGLSTATLIRIDNSIGSTISITGIVAQEAGRVLIIENIPTSSGIFLFAQESATSSAANRFSFPIVSLPARSCATIMYDGTLSRWILIGTGPNTA
jgi:hypothetical protein